jgi:hypothetical protein
LASTHPADPPPTTMKSKFKSVSAILPECSGTSLGLDCRNDRLGQRQSSKASMSQSHGEIGRGSPQRNSPIISDSIRNARNQWFLNAPMHGEGAFWTCRAAHSNGCLRCQALYQLLHANLPELSHTACFSKSGGVTLLSPWGLSARKVPSDWFAAPRRNTALVCRDLAGFFLFVTRHADPWAVKKFRF